MKSSSDRVWRATALLSLSASRLRNAIVVSFQVEAGYMERSMCLSPTFKNPYRHEIYDKMCVRVGVRTAVAKDMCSFYCEPLEGDRRFGVRCRPLRHGPMTSSFDQLWRAMLSCLSLGQPMVTDVSPGEGWLHGTVGALESNKVSTDNAATI